MSVEWGLALRPGRDAEESQVHVTECTELISAGGVLCDSSSAVLGKGTAGDTVKGLVAVRVGAGRGERAAWRTFRAVELLRGTLWRCSRVVVRSRKPTEWATPGGSRVCTAGVTAWPLSRVTTLSNQMLMRRESGCRGPRGVRGNPLYFPLIFL